MAGIIILIVLGILLFVVEFLLVPGVTVAGIGGLILTVLGVYKAFNDFGTTIGIWVFIGTLLLSIFVIAFSLRARTWKKLMLNTAVKGTVAEEAEGDELKPGDKGEAVTRLAPMGKVVFNGRVMEAKSIEGYIQEHTPVELVSVKGAQLNVKKL